MGELIVTIKYKGKAQKAKFSSGSLVQNIIDYAKYSFNIPLKENVAPFYNNKEINYAEQIGELADEKPTVEIRAIPFTKMTHGFDKKDEQDAQKYYEPAKSTSEGRKQKGKGKK